MLGSASAIAFLPSVDLDRSRRFFADRLGLTVEEVTPFACVLRAGATMLRITKVDRVQPQPFTVFDPTTGNIPFPNDALINAMTGLVSLPITPGDPMAPSLLYDARVQQAYLGTVAA